MKTHKIKLLLNFCDDVLSGDKRFEIRENDRGYQKGDRVVFQPCEPSDPFVKHPISDKVYEITYVLNGWGLKDGYVVFEEFRFPSCSFLLSFRILSKNRSVLLTI